MAESGTELKKETAAAIAYLVGPITGVIILLLEKDNFVRFHAMQSIVVFGGLFVLQIVFGLLPVLGFGVSSLLTLVGFILWLILIYKALQGERFGVPGVSKYVEKLLSQ